MEEYIERKSLDEDENRVITFNDDQIIEDKGQTHRNQENSNSSRSEFEHHVHPSFNNNPIQEEGDLSAFTKRQRLISIHNTLKCELTHREDSSHTSSNLRGIDAQKPTDYFNNSFGTLPKFQMQRQRQTSKYQKNERKLKSQESKIHLLKSKIAGFVKNYTPSGRKSMLDKHASIRNTLNDISDGILLTRDEKLIQRILRVTKHLMLKAGFKFINKIELIDPLSQRTLVLQIIFTLFNICFMVYFSLVTIYSSQQIFGQEEVLNLAIVVWIMQIVIKINTKSFKNFNLLSERSLVIESYLQNQFLYDFLPLIFLLILPKEIPQKIVCQLGVFLKIKNILLDKSYIQHRLCISVKNYYKMQLVNLISQVFIIGHVLACFWCIIGEVELHLLGYSTTWYDSGIGEDHQWYNLYLIAFNWALTLLTTGQGRADTPLQLIFISIIMIFTTIFFGYVLTVIGNIIEQIEQKDENKRYDLNVINEYIRTNNISSSIQAKINMNIEQYYANCEYSKESEGKIIIDQKVSMNIQQKIQEELLQQLLQKQALFNKKFSSATLKELASIIKEEYYQANQIIFKEDSENNIGIILVMKGTIHLTKSLQNDQQKTITVNTIQQGQVFGEINFFSGQQHQFSARSQGFTKIIRLDRLDFLEVIKKSEKDNQVFCQLQDKLNLYSDRFIFGMKCKFCQSYSHSEEFCRYLQLDKSYLYYYQKLYQNRSQIRKHLPRKEGSSLNTFLTLKSVQRCAFNYQETHAQKNEIDFSSYGYIQHMQNEGIDATATMQNIHPNSSLQSIYDHPLQNIQIFSDKEVPNQNQQNPTQKIPMFKVLHGVSQILIDDQTKQTSPGRLTQIQDNQFRFEGQKEQKSTIAVVQEKLKKRKTSILDNLERNKTRPQQFKLNFKNESSPVANRRSLKNQIGLICINEAQSEENLEQSEELSNNIIPFQVPVEQSAGIEESTFPSQLKYSDKPRGSFKQREKLLEKKEIMWDFDSLRDWKFYFPYNNSKNILIKLQKFKKKLASKIKRQTMYLKSNIKK